MADGRRRNSDGTTSVKIGGKWYLTGSKEAKAAQDKVGKGSKTKPNSKDGAVVDRGPNVIETPDTGKTGKSIKDLVPTGEFFGDLFTKNVDQVSVDNPSSIDGPIASSLRGAMDASRNEYLNSGEANPTLMNALGALQKVFDTSGQAMGQEDALLNQLTQGALNGYSPEELQVAREAARGGITGTLNSAIRGALGNAGNLGVFGRDVTRGLIQPRGANGQSVLNATTGSLADIERQLFIDNIARKDTLGEKAITLGDTIRKRRFGEQLDSSVNLTQGAFGVRKDRLDSFENMFNSTLNGGNAILNIQNTNNDNLNAFQLGKVGAFTGGMAFGDSVNTNKEVLKLQRSALNSTNNVGRSRGTGVENMATTARTWNEQGGPSNNSTNTKTATSGSEFS